MEREAKGLPFCGAWLPIELELEASANVTSPSSGPFPIPTNISAWVGVKRRREARPK